MLIPFSSNEIRRLYGKRARAGRARSIMCWTGQPGAAVDKAQAKASRYRKLLIRPR
jgi:hypothetical protein